MSTPPRRRSRRLASSATAAPSPDTPPPARLIDLPTELIERALSRCDPADIARVAAVSLLFHASLAEQGIRLWVQERGFELPAEPEDETCAVRWLCFAALLRESSPPARVAAGKQHSVFIDGEGRLSSCGLEETSFAPWLLGFVAPTMTRLTTPTRLPSTLGGERAVSVSAGDHHSLALTGGGSVWSWGNGSWGKLGHGDAQTRPRPKNVEAFAGQRVVAVSAGAHHSLAIAADGSVWSWGMGVHGKLGHGDQQRQSEPKKVAALTGRRAVAVSAGTHHSLALTADGAVWSFGCGWNGRLGHGDTQYALLPKKVEALVGQRVVAVAAGSVHTIVITADGAVWSWGWGASGKLGHGDELNRLLPKKIEALAGQHVIAVSAVNSHNLALTSGGAVWSWGNGAQYQLGHGDEQNQLLPKKVEAFAGQRVVSVAAGAAHNIALTADGAVFTWGKADTGCLGHGEDLSNQLLPKRVEEWASEPPPVSSEEDEWSDTDE